jgi:hypothetical protein
MNNNNLIHYLNSRVKVKDDITDEIYSLLGVSLSGGNEFIVFDKTSRIFNIDDRSVTPLLYPLSFLTEPIIHEGKEEIPLVELAKIEGTYNGGEYEILRDIIGWKAADSNEWLFRYSTTYNSFFKSLEGHSYTATNQLLLFQYCFTRRINLFPGTIKSIDPKECDVNPYKI